MKTSLIAVLTLLLILSCKQPTQKIASVNGVWESIGSGWVLHIQDSTRYSMYDVNAVACLPAREATFDELSAALELKNDTLFMKKGVMTYSFVKIAALPKGCSEPPTAEKKQDPLFNFEVFAATVKEHYAFMHLNKIQWQSLYEKQRSKLGETPTDIQLYTVLEETLELLNDNHAFLEASDDLYNALQEVTTEKDESDSGITLPTYGDFQVADLVAKQYLENDMTKDSWLIKWGTMNDGVGYIQIKSMWLYADLEIPKTLIDQMGYVDAYVKTFNQLDEGQYVHKEVAGVRNIMGTIMHDLMKTPSIIIDVRFNGGGQDAVSFEILKHFNTTKRQVVTTKLKYKDGFSPILSLHLDSADQPYIKPVYVLTSQQTGSAAEAFSICSMAIPHMKRIGAHTQGALSTALEKRLPNGWAYSISNEIYMEYEGNSYENKGVPVDYLINYPEDRQDFFRAVVNDLEADKHQTLKAIQALKTQE